MKELEIESISKETHPEYFFEQTTLESLRDTKGFYTAKDLS